MMRPWIDPPLNAAARWLVRLGATADRVTALSFLLGLACAASVALGQFGPALACLALGRIADGLDGAVARATQRTDRGGYLDLVADFTFYGALPFAFAWHDPAANGLAAAGLLLCFYINGATFLTYAALAARRGLDSQRAGPKSLYFSAGLAEGTETILAFALMLLWPGQFPLIAALFGLMCLVTAASRSLLAWREFP